MANVSKATLIDQGIEFPLWATEETLQALRSVMDKDYRADRSDNRTQTQAQQKTTKAIQTASNKSMEYNLRLLRTFGKMDGSFKSLKDAILASGVGGNAPAVIATSLGALDQYVKIVRQLSDVGAGLNTRYSELVNTSAEAFMFIDEFANTVSENGIAIRNLGGSATEGFKAFAKLSRQLQTSTREFGMYGMQQEELNELLLTQIEIERQSGATMGDATERTAAAMEDLVRETSGMAEVTGRSRREAMREAQGAVQRTDVSTYLRQVRAREGDTAADTERIMIQDLSKRMQMQFGKEMGQKFTDDFIKAYVTGGGLAVAEELQKIAGVSDVSKIQDIIKALGSRDKDSLGAAINEFGLEMERVNLQTDPLMISLNEGFQLAAQAAADFRKMSVAELKLAGEQQEAELKANTKRIILSAENVQRQILADVAGAKNAALVIAGDITVNILKIMDKWAEGSLSSGLAALPGGISFFRDAVARFAGAESLRTPEDARSRLQSGSLNTTGPHPPGSLPVVTAPTETAGQAPGLLEGLSNSIIGAIAPSSASIAKEIKDLKITINSLYQMLKENL